MIFSQDKNESLSFIRGTLICRGIGSCVCNKSLELKSRKFEYICMKVLQRHLRGDVCLMSHNLNKIFFMCKHAVSFNPFIALIF